MPADVNVAEYAEVPRAQSGSQTVGVIQICGPLIKARDVAVDGAASYQLQGATRYVGIYNHGTGAIYAATAAASGALEQGHGPPVAAGTSLTIAARQSHRWLLLTERA